MFSFQLTFNDIYASSINSHDQFLVSCFNDFVNKKRGIDEHVYNTCLSYSSFSFSVAYTFNT